MTDPPRLALVACAAIVGLERCALLGLRSETGPAREEKEGAGEEEAIVALPVTLVVTRACGVCAGGRGLFTPFRGWPYCEGFGSMMSGVRR